MGTTFDRRGNAHHGAGTPGGGRFASKTNSPPPSPLVEIDDEDEWRRRMEAVLSDGEQEPVSFEGPEVNLLDRDTWGDAPF